MKERLITGMIYGIVVLVLLFAHPISREILLMLIPITAGMEYLKVSKASKPEIILAIVFGIGIFALSKFGYLADIRMLFPLLLINLLLVINLIIDPPFIKHEKSKVLLVLLYIVAPFALAIHHGWTSGALLLVATFLLIWISDSGAFFVGSRIGKRKLASKISPNKTIEGFLGAGLLTIIASYIIFSVVNQYTLQFWILFGLIVWIFGSIGDLVESHVKRLFGIKDSGSMLPGHGGFYDRFDSIIFVIPFLLALVIWYGGVPA